MTDELVKAYRLHDHMAVCACGQPEFTPLSAAAIGKFHADAYVSFLQQVAYDSYDVVEDAASYVLNASVCFSETAWLYSQTYAGGSVAAATSLAKGDADIAINWMGGQTHARRDCASGFSYLNDAVLATLSLLTKYERVMFVNMDAWHSSGVEEAFYTSVSFCLAPLSQFWMSFHGLSPRQACQFLAPSQGA
jgi:acetoin utilization deacetylase AcuC-like enzyme